jgi:hypothetical protein
MTEVCTGLGLSAVEVRGYRTRMTSERTYLYCQVTTEWKASPSQLGVPFPLLAGVSKSVIATGAKNLGKAGVPDEYHTEYSALLCH